MTQEANIAFILMIFMLCALQDFIFCIAPIPSHNSSAEFGAQNLSSATSSPNRPTRYSPVKKWQVGRVSRKQYEIVNMLRRKTKIFVDLETTTQVENRIRRNNVRTPNRFEYHINPLTYTSPQPVVASTPSYIEFYYLDDNDERVKHRGSLATNGITQRQLLAKENVQLYSPILSFRIDNYLRTSTSIITPHPEKNKIKPKYQHQEKERHSVYGFLSSRFKLGLFPNVKQHSTFNSTNTTSNLRDETCPSTTLGYENVNGTQHTETTTYSDIIIDEIELDTTPNDKIKFFEIYDQQTMKPLGKSEKQTLNADHYENMVRENYIDDNKLKIRLEDVDQKIDHHDGNKTKNVKKHVKQGVVKQDKKSNFKTVSFNINKTIAEIRSEFRNKPKNSSRSPAWYEYPFAAVYIYEPLQIYCDAASLSSHWLVAAGSCLSRFHTKDPLSEGRSAFVAYCGLNWWHPERVSYVKYSIVHPRFHPKDKSRRLFYNIGLVQVVGSMSSCSGWAPITLMSHHFTADIDGSAATAVGWGLDRYDARYSLVELPKLPLSAYDGFVYSDSCPGSAVFRSGKHEERSLKNIYCLSLPPYSGERNDPVHGSLLLFGGKLIALYLQEERRVWGPQSAQYTGVWGLVPWVHEVAREQDDTDAFVVDI